MIYDMNIWYEWWMLDDQSGWSDPKRNFLLVSFSSKYIIYIKKKFGTSNVCDVQLDPVVSLRMKHVHYLANTIHTDTSRTVLESPSDKEHGSKV